MNGTPITLGITPGDPNGIGYEVMIKALANNKILDLMTPVIYASPKVFAYYKKALNLESKMHYHLIPSAAEIKAGQINFVNSSTEELDEAFRVCPGEASEMAGVFALDSLLKVTEELKNGNLDGLVTGPIDKYTINGPRFPFSGHTDFLASHFAMVSEKSLMLLVADNCIVAPLTTHIPLAEVPAAVTKELIVEKCLMLDIALKRDFGIEKPLIGVMALNPHAGDNGLLGAEENTVIKPAIEDLFETHKVHAFGPFSPDGYWGNGIYEKFDATLCMYHDQGLIPFKLKNMMSGVNFTAGLNIVRSSPDHGTAYDIAGGFTADETSFRNAIYLACDVIRNRKTFDEAIRNPLRKTFYDRGKDADLGDLPENSEEN